MYNKNNEFYRQYYSDEIIIFSNKSLISQWNYNYYIKSSDHVMFNKQDSQKKLW